MRQLLIGEKEVVRAAGCTRRLLCRSRRDGLNLRKEELANLQLQDKLGEAKKKRKIKYQVGTSSIRGDVSVFSHIS